jgi:hypothetical protein
MTASGPLSRARTLQRLVHGHAREGHLSELRQWCEMTILKLRGGIGLNYYQTAGFFRRDIPWSDKAAHLGASELVARLAQLNPLPYRKLSQHKLAEKALLTLLRVPTPAYLGYVHPVAGRTAAGLPLRTEADFEQFIESLPCDRICFKLMEGHGGKGFIAVQRVRTSTGTRVGPLFATGEPAESAGLPVNGFFQRHLASSRKARLVEEYLEQHEAYRIFNPTSVNTLRVWAYSPVDRPAIVLGAYLRIGRAGALVDNHAAGGIVAPIDIDSGVLRAATDGLPTYRAYPTHPDSGVPIEGVRLAFWREAMELAAMALTVFPKTRLAGLDIAVAPTGPVVIELNNYPGLDGVGVSNLQLARLLKD